MNSLASEKQKRSPASSPVGDTVIRPAAASFIKSIVRTALATLCCSFFATGPAHGQSDVADAPSASGRVPPSPVILTSGTYRGVWRDEDGKTGETTIVIDVDGQSVTGKLSVSGVSKYSGDRIRGDLAENADGALEFEFKTRDGMWKSKAVYDGQLLIGAFYYEFQDRRVQKLIKGEWAAEKVADDT
jgi:hypothetical protein